MRAGALTLSTHMQNEAIARVKHLIWNVTQEVTLSQNGWKLFLRYPAARPTTEVAGIYVVELPVSYRLKHPA